MGYLLKEALKTLCGVNQWSYAVFWKIGSQNPKLLIWEECYYEPFIYSNDEHGVQATNKIHLLVTKMMKDNYINVVGEGLVGRVAFSRNHQWILRDNKLLHVQPTECYQVSNEVYAQFSAGIQTIVVIPIHPHGVVQLGSTSTIMENAGFVNDVKSLISQLGCVPGALLSENYMNNQEPISNGFSASCHSAGKSKVTDRTVFTPDMCNQRAQARAQVQSPQASGRSGPGCTSFSFGTPVTSQNSTNPEPKNGQQTAFGPFLANYDPLRLMEQHILSDAFLGDGVNDTMMSQITNESNNADEQCTRVKLTSNREKLEHELFQALTMSSEEACLKPSSSDDLFDIVGIDFKTKSFDKSHNSFVKNGIQSNPINPVRNDRAIYDGKSDSGIHSSTDSDLLDAVVSKIHSSSKQIVNDNWGIDLMQKESTGGHKSLNNTGVTGSVISSQISSWADQRHEMKKDSFLSSGYSKKSDDISKSNRKRLKPGESPRPRPKDRQMIQDRVKELREIVPGSAKCSIDALLERTIKHMIFLQSVAKHADKIKQIGDSKIVSKDGGLLLRDNFEGGATWAYEVGSQSMVCPIIVEDLNSPRQMLVEMLCEDRGSFLEIADGVKGLGLTILKGVMEYRNDKIWAHFTVEANRDVTRMEIFISLVSLLDQAAKNGADCSMNTSAREQSFHQLSANPIGVGPGRIL